MSKLVEPRVYLIGATAIDWEGLQAYLRDTGNGDFLESVSAAMHQGASAGEVLTSFYAKLCYASLTLGKNANVQRIRDISANLMATLGAGHGSVFEHVSINFVITGCSRVFTHELVRHRVGTAFSQTSGRYVRGDSIDFVHDPILNPVKDIIEETLQYVEGRYKQMVAMLELDAMTNFDQKKKVTSALRRILPNGQSNEMGFSINLRALRHTVMMRCAEAAEWEIRKIFGEVYRLVKARYPLVFCDAVEATSDKDGLLTVSGMKTNPWG